MVNKAIKDAIKPAINTREIKKVHKTDITDIDKFDALEAVIDRKYIPGIATANKFGDVNLINDRVTWLQIVRLPVHPTNQEFFDLTTHWQNVLSTFNVWGNKFVFLLIRHDGQTNIFIGVASSSKATSGRAAVKQLRQATSAAIPGIEVKNLDNEETLNLITDKLLGFNSLGTITGIPSFRAEKNTMNIQTLDALSFGFKSEFEEFTDYATLVISEPISEQEIDQTLSDLRDISSELHEYAKRNKADSINDSSSFDGGISFGLSEVIKLSAGKSHTRGYSTNMSREIINKTTAYLEETVDKYIERLKRGRNLGFWNSGVYVLAKNDNDVKTVLGILKSIYSGDYSYIEPIRTTVLNSESNAMDLVRLYNILPNPFFKDDSHPFGSMFNKISTPMNTEELSIVTALPRRDVPGIRFSKTAVRFATNPGEVEEGSSIKIGNILDMGVQQKKEYLMNVDALVRHALVSGCTGSGKSTTCKKFLKEVDKRNIPSLIIEPAKDDYVRWAIKYNKDIDANENLSEEEKENLKYDIYMPGVKEMDGYKFKKLKLNPFEPAAIKGAPIDLMSRYEQAVNIINASIPTSDVLPVLIDETIYKFMNDFFGSEFTKTETEQVLEYPKVSGLVPVAREVLAQRNYDSKVQNDLAAALETRLNYLSRGKRGDILDVRKSTDFDRLFNKKTVINLSRLIGTKDKSLVMSFLIVALYEYRNSAFSYDKEYREKANQNKLLHLTLIEEAHNLLQNPEADFSGSGNAQKVSADMFTNILSEIRSYGQGLIIVDQVPTRLIPDAVKNTNYKIIHRLTAADDAKAVAASMALSEEQASIISKLKIGETIIFGDLDDSALWVKINNN